jgi:hypothetical protein
MELVVALSLNCFDGLALVRFGKNFFKKIKHAGFTKKKAKRFYIC